MPEAAKGEGTLSRAFALAYAKPCIRRRPSPVRRAHACETLPVRSGWRLDS